MIVALIDISAVLAKIHCSFCQLPWLPCQQVWEVLSVTLETSILLGAPVQEGAGRLGCDMGPSAFPAAGLAAALKDLGYPVADRGTLAPAPICATTHDNAAIKALPEVVACTEASAGATSSAS